MTLPDSTVTASLQMYRPNASLGASYVGRGGVSSDGLGQLTPGGDLQADIPSGSTVQFALLYAATVFGGSTTDLIFNGQLVQLTPLPNVANPSLFNTTRADVTSIVAASVGSGGGVYDFSVESDPTNPLLNGVSLVVVYSNKTLPERSIFIFDGGLGFESETTTFNFARPIRKAKTGFQVTLSLGIQHGFQGPGSDSAGTHLCGDVVAQFSIVEVNGRRLSTCAGNYDDGFASDGALVTVGGVGDSLDNPSSPLQSPGDGQEPRTLDDELYDITAFVNDGDTALRLTTENPSRDDSIFLAIVRVTGDATSPGSATLLPWPFEEPFVGDATWHNHDTPGTCLQSHLDGHLNDHPCGYGDNEGDHLGNDAYAQDWNWSFGSPPEESTKVVLSVLDGSVIFVKSDWTSAKDKCGGYGNQVIVVNAAGTLALRYTHLSSVSVSRGPIEVAQPIGVLGGTGCWAPHLHVAAYTRLDATTLGRLARGQSACAGKSAIDCAVKVQFVP